MAYKKYEPGCDMETDLAKRIRNQLVNSDVDYVMVFPKGIPWPANECFRMTLESPRGIRIQDYNPIRNEITGSYDGKF